MGKMTSRCRYMLQLTYIRGNVSCFFTFLPNWWLGCFKKKKEKEKYDQKQFQLHFFFFFYFFSFWECCYWHWHILSTCIRLNVFRQLYILRRHERFLRIYRIAYGKYIMISANGIWRHQATFTTANGLQSYWEVGCSSGESHHPRWPRLWDCVHVSPVKN